MKKNLVTKVMSLLLVGVMMLGLIACGNEQPKESSQTPEPSKSETPAPSESKTEEAPAVEDTKSIYPLDTDVEISVYLGSAATLNPEYDSYEKSYWHSKVSEKTGVTTTFVPEIQDSTALEIMLTDKKQAPDIFNVANQGVAKYKLKVEDGYALDLTDYLEEYAPNYWEYIHRPEKADFLKQIQDEDGRFYFISSDVESDFNITYMGPMVRKDWLDECGLKEPVTLEDFEKVLVAFKDKYGAKLAGVYSDFNNTGISSGTGAYAGVRGGWQLKDGKTVHSATTPEWKKMIEVFVDWNKKGLIDGDFFTADRNILRQKVAEGKTGMVFTAMSQLTNYIQDAEAEGGSGAEWIGCGYPRTAPDAPTTFIQATAAWSDQCNFMVSGFVEEEKIPVILAWIDYFYTEEGMLFSNFGIEGETYTMVDGVPKFTELVTKDPSGMGQAVTKYAAWNGTFIGIQMDDFLRAKNELTPAVTVAVDKWTENTAYSKYMEPKFTLTTDENKQYKAVYNPINTWIKEEVAKILNLEKEVDWAAFDAKLAEMGIEEATTIRNAAYQRYLAR